MLVIFECQFVNDLLCSYWSHFLFLNLLIFLWVGLFFEGHFLVILNISMVIVWKTYSGPLSSSLCLFGFIVDELYCNFILEDKINRKSYDFKVTLIY